MGYSRSRTILLPIFTYCKKHYCFECGSELTIVQENKIINSKSPEAKDYDFSVSCSDTMFSGDVEFVWNEFRCSQCGVQIPIKKQRQLEKEAKGDARERKRKRRKKRG